MAPDPGPLWNHRGGQQRLGCSSLEFLTDLAAAFGPKRVFSSVEWVMKLISKKKKKHRTVTAPSLMFYSRRTHNCGH